MNLRIAQGKRLAQARQKAGYKSARRAAIENGWPESSYRAHENGSRTIGLDDAERYAKRFTQLGAQVTAKELLFEEGSNNVPPVTGKIVSLTGNKMRSEYVEPAQLLGERDLPVFASVEGGEGQIVVGIEVIDLVPRPWFLERVRDAMAVLVSGESMHPAYDAGDMVLINPNLPVKPGKNHIFTTENEDGRDYRAIVKHLVKMTATEWTVRQFNPPEGAPAEYTLSRAEWPTARRIVGKYEGN